MINIQNNVKYSSKCLVCGTSQNRDIQKESRILWSIREGFIGYVKKWPRQGPHT